jgi:hypothetical protein
MLVSMACSAVLILELSFVDSFLQEQVDTVTLEGVESVGEEDWIEIKTEEDYIELVGRVKCEQEVSVLCCVFVICVLVCVSCTVHCVQLHTLFILAYHIISVCA